MRIRAKLAGAALALLVATGAVRAEVAPAAAQVRPLLFGAEVPAVAV